LRSIKCYCQIFHFRCIQILLVCFQNEDQFSINQTTRKLSSTFESTLLFLNRCAGWGYIVAFTKVLTMYQICHIWIHPLSPFSFILLLPHSCNSFNRSHFSCEQDLHYIHPPTPFPHLLPHPTGTSLPRKDLLCPPVLWFCKRQKMTFLPFCLFKIAMQGKAQYS
jgi:hypothetical protein